MAPQDDPVHLVELSRRGDRAAFARLIGPLKARLQSLICRQIGSALRLRIDPEDVLQETLLRALRTINRLEYKGEKSLLRWLATISRHVVLEEASKAARERAEPLVQDVAQGAPSQSRAARRRERFDRLQGAFDHLRPEEQKAIYLARIERVPVQEIARQLDRTPNAVSHMLLRALKRLRERIGDTESLSLPDIALRARGDEHHE